MTESSNNIIQGPWAKAPPLPLIPSEKDATLSIESIHKNNIAAVSATVLDYVLEHCAAGGFRFNFTDDTYLKDLCLIVESIKALLHKHHNLEHPLHKVSDHLFEMHENIARYKDFTKESVSETLPAINDQEVGIIEPLDEEDFDEYI